MLQDALPKHVETMLASQASAAEITGESTPDMFLRLLRETDGRYAIATNQTTEEEQKNKGRLTPRREQQRMAALRGFSSTFKDAKSFVGDLKLSSKEVTENDGVLQIDGEDISLEERIVLESNSQACSAYITQDEIDMNQFMQNPDMNNIPPAIAKLAEDRGLNPQEVTVDQYADFIREQYPDHAVNIITSPDITATNFDNVESLLNGLSGSSEADWERTPEDVQTINPEDRLSSASPDLESQIRLPGMRADFTSTIGIQPDAPRDVQPSSRDVQPSLSVPQQELGLNQMAPTAPQGMG
jgi:hypothetical protein